MVNLQKILIKNLGVIKNFESDVKKVNLLIGEQATGKSTISKCIYFFRIIKAVVVEDIYSKILEADEGEKTKKIPKSLNPRVKEIFVELFGYSWDLNENLYLKYDFNDTCSVEVKLNVGDRGKRFISINFGYKLIESLKVIEKSFVDKYSYTAVGTNFTLSFLSSERARLHQEISDAVNSVFDDNMDTYYIPAGRNLLTLMFNQKTKIDYDSMDLVNKNFMQFIESIQNKFDKGIQHVHKYYPVDKRNFDVKTQAEAMIRDLKGDYFYTKGDEYLYVNENVKVKINYASSGQQEILWLMLQLYVLMLKNEKAFVIIEEPEAHLYPSLQKKIFDYIVQYSNINDSSVLVTTHSPYILMAANTAYQAGKLINLGKRSQVEKITGKHKFIIPDNISAIKLVSDNHFENLVDIETDELKTSMIDDISQEINAVYTELFYLEADDENSR